VLRYPPRMSPLAPGQGKRAAAQGTERSESDGKCGQRGARMRGDDMQSSVMRGRISQLRCAGGRGAS